MKKTMLMLGALGSLALASCTSKPSDSKLTISFPDSTLSGQYVHIMDINEESDKTAMVDSILINGNTAEYVHPADTMKMYALVFNSPAGRYRAFYVPEAGEYKVDIINESAPKGTRLNDEIVKYFEKRDAMREEFKAKFDELRQDSTMAPEVRDSIARALHQSGLESFDKDMRAVYAANKLNAVGSFVLANLLPGLELDELKAMIEEGGDAVKANKNIQSFLKKKEMFAETTEGKMFKDVQGVSVSDTTQVVSLSEYVGKGNYVIADFWASWCGPCRREVEFLKEAYKKYHAKGLEIVGLSVWDEYEANLKAIDELKITWPQIFDNKKTEIANTYGVMGIPTIVLFDKDGTIISRELRGEELLSKLAELYK